MTFAHEDSEFNDLIRIVSEENGINPALIEKDYWVTHALWALQNGGFEIWFKGGTSLSKGFKIIRRFSEDLDLKISPGSTTVPEVENWKSDGTGHRRRRQEYFEALADVLDVPGAESELQEDSEQKWKSGSIHINYPGKFFDDLPSAMRPFVLLEIGNARVQPFVERRLSSFVHAWLERESHLLDFDDNRPQSVRCVHPAITLIEKIESIVKNYGRKKEASEFVRHYEDSAAIIDFLDANEDSELRIDARELYRDMREGHDIRVSVTEGDDAFQLTARITEIQAAYDAIEPMYWGPRTPLREACVTIRKWIRQVI